MSNPMKENLESLKSPRPSDPLEIERRLQAIWERQQDRKSNKAKEHLRKLKETPAGRRGVRG
jgi:hypothetical protein